MNVFEVGARIGCDTSEYDKALDRSESKMSSFAGKLKSGIGTIAKVTAAGLTAAAAGVAAISKQAVESYADYEQLVGGVETLFKDSAGKVQEYANEAYRTAGLSANEYMETVTGFSASLLQSLEGDTEKAAEKSNQALIDMSDNANKMGSDMEMIKNAYSGFAKANYTMLDNLKLGYGGTKQEMERLLADAEKFSGIHYDISSYADVIDAIHVIQTEMGITGTTAKEAATTISGSIGMMKSSWQNLITGVADDTQDFDKLIDNFVDSVDTVAQNIMPRVEQALNGVGKLVEKLVPNIIERIPEILTSTLPTLTSAVTKLMSTLGNTITANADTLLLSVVRLLGDVFDKVAQSPSLGDGLNKLVETLSLRIPQIFGYLTSIGIKIAEKIADGVVENTDAILNGISRVFSDIIDSIGVIAPVLIDTGFQILMKIGKGIIEHVPDLIETAIVTLEDFAAYLADNASVMLPKLVKLVGDIAKMLTDPEAIGRLVDVGLDIIMTLTDAIIEAIPVLVDALPEVIQNIVTAITDNLPKLLDAGWDIIKALTEALFANLPLIIDAGKQIIDSLGVGIVQALMQLYSKYDEICNTIADLIIEAYHFAVDGIKNKINAVKQAISDVTTAIKNKFQETINKSIDWGKNLIQKIIDGVKSKIQAIKDAIGNVTTAIKDKFDEAVRGAMDWGRNLIQNFVDKVKEKWNAIKDGFFAIINGIRDSFTDIVSRARTWGENLIKNFKEKFVEKWNAIKDGFFDKVGDIKKSFTNVVDKAKNWGKDLIDNFINGIQEKWEALKKKVTDVAQLVKDYLHFSEPDEGPLSDFHTYAPDMIDLFAEGIAKNAHKITDAVNAALTPVSGLFEAQGNNAKSTAFGDTNNIFNITVQAGTISNDYDANRAAQIMAERIATLQTQQRRAIGL